MNKKQAIELANANIKKAKVELNEETYNAYVKNILYWGNRREQDLVAAEKLGLDLEKRLLKEYKKAIRNIDLEVKAIYTDYLDEEISLSEMNKKLNKQQLKQFRQSLNEYYEAIENEGYDLEGHKADLKRLMQRVSISRLEQIKLNVKHQIKLLEGKEKQLIEETLKDTIDLTMENIANDFNMEVDFETPQEEFMKTTLMTKTYGKNFAQRIGVNNDLLIDKLQQIMVHSFVTGESVNKLSSKLNKQTAVGYSNAKRIIRTEINRCCNQTTFKMLKDSNITESYQFLATLDSRTSDICTSMNDLIFKYSEGEVGVNIPPLHPNCRSTIVPYFPPDEFDIYLAPLTPQGYTQEQLMSMGIELPFTKQKPTKNDSSVK